VQVQSQDSLISQLQSQIQQLTQSNKDLTSKLHETESENKVLQKRVESLDRERAAVKSDKDREALRFSGMMLEISAGLEAISQAAAMASSSTLGAPLASPEDDGGGAHASMRFSPGSASGNGGGGGIDEQRMVYFEVRKRLREIEDDVRCLGLLTLGMKEEVEVLREQVVIERVQMQQQDMYDGIVGGETLEELEDEDDDENESGNRGERGDSPIGMPLTSSNASSAGSDGMSSLKFEKERLGGVVEEMTAIIDSMKVYRFSFEYCLTNAT
jgi:hypothetical protein